MSIIKLQQRQSQNRLKRVLPRVLQDLNTTPTTGFIKGRNINENIRTIFEVLDFVEEENIPGLIFFSDFQKAFDSINHAYLFKSLKPFIFSKNFIKWIKLLF